MRVLLGPPFGLFAAPILAFTTERLAPFLLKLTIAAGMVGYVAGRWGRRC